MKYLGISYIVAYSPQISKNVIYPHIVSILSTKTRNVCVVCSSLTFYTLFQWLTIETGVNITACQSVIFLNSVERFEELWISFADEYVKGMIPTFANVVCAMFAT